MTAGTHSGNNLPSDDDSPLASDATVMYVLGPPPEPALSYIIATTPRTGSWLLVHLLRDTNVAGLPDEYFNPEHEEHLMRIRGVESFNEYIDDVKRFSLTSNLVFGLKVMREQFEQRMIPRLRTLPGMKGLSEAEVVSRAFTNTRYIFMRRQDKVKQAISFEKARQTGIWSRQTTTSDTSTSDLTFDYAVIRGHVRQIEHEEACWQEYFRGADIEPLEILYEGVAADPGGSVRRVLDFLEIECPPDLKVRPRLQRQFDAVNADWLRRYHECERTTSA